MHRYAFLLIIAAGAFAMTANTSRSSAADPEPSSAETSNPGESITGEIAVPNEAPLSIPRNPFEAYSIGETTPDSNPAWDYQQLNEAERNVVDAGRDASSWSGIHDTYKQAAVLRAAQAQAQAATIRLGVDNLGEGVVP